MYSIDEYMSNPFVCADRVTFYSPEERVVVCLIETRKELHDCTKANIAEQAMRYGAMHVEFRVTG